MADAKVLREVDEQIFHMGVESSESENSSDKPGSEVDLLDNRYLEVGNLTVRDLRTIVRVVQSLVVDIGWEALRIPVRWTDVHHTD